MDNALSIRTKLLGVWEKPEKHCPRFPDWPFPNPPDQNQCDHVCVRPSGSAPTTPDCSRLMSSHTYGWTITHSDLAFTFRFINVVVEHDLVECDHKFQCPYWYGFTIPSAYRCLELEFTGTFFACQRCAKPFLIQFMHLNLCGYKDKLADRT